MEDFLTPGEAARILCVEESTLRRWFGRGLLRGIVEVRHTAGGQRRYSRTGIEQLAIMKPWERERAQQGEASETAAPCSWLDQIDDIDEEAGMDDDFDDWCDMPAVSIDHVLDAVGLVPSAADLIPDLAKGIDLGDRVGRFDNERVVSGELSRRAMDQQRPPLDELMNIPGSCELSWSYFSFDAHSPDVQERLATFRSCGWDIDTDSGSSEVTFYVTKSFDNAHDAIDDAAICEITYLDYTPESGQYNLEFVIADDGTYTSKKVYRGSSSRSA